MVVRLVARVRVDDMNFDVIYPENADEERIAKLTGIVQLVSAALKRSETDEENVPMFMKSEKSVIGYCQVDNQVLICEADAEGETADALRALISKANSSHNDLEESIKKIIHKRGKEIGDLWR